MAVRWYRTSSRSRRPHHGVSSHSVAANPASRVVRKIVPVTVSATYSCRSMVSTASTASSVTRPRNTLGRMTSRRFTVSATSRASGSAPWVMS